MRVATRWPALSGGVALVVVLSACSMGGSTSATPSRGSDVVSLAEIEESSATNAFDLLSQIRPNWLRGRGSPSLRRSSPVLPVVYVAGVRHGALDTLRTIPTISIDALRYVDAPSATMRYGDGHSGGVIEVMIRRR